MRFQTPCFQSWHSSDTDADACLEAVACNWNSAISSSLDSNSAADYAAQRLACELRGDANASAPVPFCGVSDNGFDYREIAGATQAQCLNASSVACVRANGQVVLGTTGACAAAALESCDQPQYTNASACNAGGHCSNDYMFYDKAGTYHAAGVCLYPSDPWHLNECEGLNSGERPVPEGCITYVLNEATCLTRAGRAGTWITPATTKAACDALPGQCRRAIREKEVGQYFNDELWTLQSQADCVAEGAEWVFPKYTWVQPRWLPAVERTGLR